MKKMKVSLIITAHNEGKLLEKAILSAIRALENTQASADVIIHVDNGTKETLKCCEEYEGKNMIRVLQNKFGDVGPARNFAAEQAWGEFLFFMDGDDLISQNYIRDGLEILIKSKKEIVVCPEYCISFSDDAKTGAILKMANSSTREKDAFLLFNINLWTAAIAGRRETFLKHQYIETKDGYGHEDYAMNIALTAAGVKHIVVPGETYFYREKEKSRRKENDAKKVTEPYSDLFASEFWRGFSSKMEEQARSEAKSFAGRMKQTYSAIKGNRVIGKVLTPAMKTAKSLMGKQLMSSNLPKEVIEEWDQLSVIEPKLKRKGKKINAMGSMGVNPYCPASEAYLELCRNANGFSGINFKKLAKRLDDEQKDLLASRIMVQSKGQASFRDKQTLERWKTEHTALAKSLGL